MGAYHQRVTTVFCALALLGGVVAAAQAQTTSRKVTYFNFDRSVELPGNRTLAPGRYEFRIADEGSLRRIVQVLSEDGRSRALLLSIPAERQGPAPESQVQFMETAENQPSAVKIYWYGGESRGFEFVYPKDQAMRLARATGTNVPMTESPMDTEEELRTAEVTRTELEAEPTPRPTETAARRTEAADDEIRAGRTAETTVARAEPSGRTRLPQTASPFPLIGLLGALALAGAGGLRLFR